jgi:hypothetical protein
MTPRTSPARRPNRLAAFAVGATFAALLASAAPAKASDLLLVDPSVPTAYTEIQPAVDAANPGDIVVVRPLVDANARYLPFAVGGKSLTIVGQGTLGTIRATMMTITDTASGDIVIVRGLAFAAIPGLPGVVVTSGDGMVRLEDIISVGGVGDTVAPGPGLFAHLAGSVIINNCQFTGGAALTGAPVTQGAPGLQGLDAHLSVRGGTYVGGAGANGVDGVVADGGLGGAGVQVHGGWQYISEAHVVGGAGGEPGCSGVGPCDCGVIGNGGDGVVETDTVVVLAAMNLQPGSPSESLCSAGFSGQPISQNGGIVQQLDTPEHIYTLSYPAQTGVKAKFHFKGEVGEYIFISASYIPLNMWIPKYDGALQLLSSNILDFYFLRIIDKPDGTHDTTHPVTDPPPGVDGGIIYTQAFFVTFSNGSPTKIHLGPSATFIFIGYGP